MSVIAVLFLVAQAQQQVTVESGDIARRVSIESGHVHTDWIRNDAAERTLRVRGPEFALTYGDGASVTSDTFNAIALKATPDGAECMLEHDALGLHAVITYESANGAPWLYKQIRIENNGANSFLLRTVELEHLVVNDESITYSVDPAFPSVSDWGQPVYTESLWFGVEFPAARSAATRDGAIFLRHHPGIELKPGDTYTSKRAVVGAGATGDLQRPFFDYIRTLSPLPNPPRANIYWNGFRVVKPPDRTPQGIAMIEYAKQLKAETGFAFDGWSYDAGFDMYRPDALFVPNEPAIWDETRAALKPIDTPLGFWASFSPIFDTPTHAWGKTQGYELQHDASYCLAGPVYFPAIKSRLEDIVRTYGMNAINFDGMFWGQGFGCNVAGHGHLVGDGPEAGVYATERIVENKLAIFESLRRINPKIVLDLFVCNEWASPWWLMQLDGVHTVAGDTLGCDIPSPWLRDELITVRDIQVFDEHRRLRRQFPLWAEDLYGNQVRRDHLIDGVVVTGEDMAARWEDEYVLALAGRGPVQNHIVCSDLDVLSKSAGGLKFLGEVGNWVRDNAPIYRNFRLIGGEPSKRQPYGYTHGDLKGRSLIALRNPWIEPRTFELKLDNQLDLGMTNENLTVTVVYPYRETLAEAAYGTTVHIPLPDYAVMLLEVRTASRAISGAPSGRWSTVGDTATNRLDESVLDELPSGRLRAELGEASLRLMGSVSVPQHTTAHLHLMLLPNQSAAPAVRVTVNDIAIEPAIHHRQRDAKEDAWAIVDMPSGSHAIDINLEGHGAGTLGAWLVASYDLPVLSTTNSVPGERLFPVYEANTDRRVTTLLPPTPYTLPLPAMPEGEKVSLSEFKGRCLMAKVGFFHVGWDQSCWPDQPELRVGGTMYKAGIGVHSPSELVFDIGGAFKTFSAEIGMHGVPAARKAPGGAPGTSVFIVEGDGRALFSSPVMREGDAASPVSLDVTGVKLLTLRTTDAGDGKFDDLATWGNVAVSR